MRENYVCVTGFSGLINHIEHNLTKQKICHQSLVTKIILEWLTNTWRRGLATDNHGRNINTLNQCKMNLLFSSHISKHWKPQHATFFWLPVYTPRLTFLNAFSAWSSFDQKDLKLIDIEDLTTPAYQEFSPLCLTLGHLHVVSMIKEKQVQGQLISHQVWNYSNYVTIHSSLVVYLDIPRGIN